MHRIEIDRTEAETLKGIIEVGYELDEDHPQYQLVQESGDSALGQIAADIDNGNETVAIDLTDEQVGVFKMIVEVGSEVDGEEEDDKRVWAVADKVDNQIDAILNATQTPGQPKG